MSVIFFNLLVIASALRTIPGDSHLYLPFTFFLCLKWSMGIFVWTETKQPAT